MSETTLPDRVEATLRAACAPRDMDTVRDLFEAYQRQVGIDLCFQNFEAELAGLPGDYAAPDGVILLTELDAEAVGCVALKPLPDRVAAGRVCEMKRLYVRPAAAGLGLGRALVEAALCRARARGYAEMWLDTLGRMDRAVALYRSLGFREIHAYTANPEPDVIYLGKALPAPAG